MNEQGEAIAEVAVFGGKMTNSWSISLIDNNGMLVVLSQEVTTRLGPMGLLSKIEFKKKGHTKLTPFHQFSL